MRRDCSGYDVMKGGSGDNVTVAAKGPMQSIGSGGKGPIVSRNEILVMKVNQQDIGENEIGWKFN